MSLLAAIEQQNGESKYIKTDCVFPVITHKKRLLRTDLRHSKTVLERLMQARK